jgi:hypothetical protein
MEVRAMNYKNWSLLPKKELNGIAVDYTDPNGQVYSAPFCFYTLEEALNYGKMCIDQSIRSRTGKGVQEVQQRVIG